MDGVLEIVLLGLLLATCPSCVAIEQRYLLGDSQFQSSKVFNLTECKDYLPNCPSYDYTVCRDYQPWALQRCPAYCQYCPPDSDYTTTATPCTDVLPHCSAYNADTCSNPLYFNWAHTNCKKFCNLCHETPFTRTYQRLCTLRGGYHPEARRAEGCNRLSGYTISETTHQVFTLHHSTTPLPTTTDPNCHDTISNCASYGRKACTDYKDWAGIRCKAFCFFCGTTPPPTTPPPCADTLGNCASFQQDTCLNPLYKSWAQNNCRAFCGLCTTTSMGATTATLTTPTTTTQATTTTTTTTPHVHIAFGATGPVGPLRCIRKGHTHKEGETWTDGNQYTCTCQNAELNHISCKDRCPVWNGLPDYCKSLPQEGGCPVIQCIVPDDSAL